MGPIWPVAKGESGEVTKGMERAGPETSGYMLAVACRTPCVRGTVREAVMAPSTGQPGTALSY